VIIARDYYPSVSYKFIIGGVGKMARKNNSGIKELKLHWKKIKPINKEKVYYLNKGKIFDIHDFIEKMNLDVKSVKYSDLQAIRKQARQLLEGEVLYVSYTLYPHIVNTL
jgi:hypothetical protein